jgi:hydroxymethylbilane synthase
LRKLQDENWDAAIFAQAGLERIDLRPDHSMIIDWMLPAPAQGAIVVVCREDDINSLDACKKFSDRATEICTKVERDFLRTLLGGCSTPISALAEIKNGELIFKGNILSLDGKEKLEVEKKLVVDEAPEIGKTAAAELLAKGGNEILNAIRYATK